MSDPWNDEAPNINLQRSKTPTRTFTVAAAEADSQSIHSPYHATAWVHSAARTISWYGSLDGINFFPIEDDSGAVTQTFTAEAVRLLPDACFGCPYLKAVSATPGTIEIILLG